MHPFVGQLYAKMQKNLLDSSFDIANIIHQCTVSQFPFKNKGFIPDSHYIYEKSTDFEGAVPELLSTPCEHCGKFNPELKRADIHKYFPQAVHISEKELWK
jgi:hypothetical protein